MNINASEAVRREVTSLHGGYGEYARFTAREDGLACALFLERNIVIPIADLPECKVVERDGQAHVDCGSDWGTWNIKHLDRMRETALEYVAAWITAEEWVSTESRTGRRRDELARELASDANKSVTWSELGVIAQRAIDRIIELEGGDKTEEPPKLIKRPATQAADLLDLDDNGGH